MTRFEEKSGLAKSAEELADLELAGEELDAADIEFERKLAKLSGKASVETLAGGASRGVALAITILAAIGAFSSLELVLSEKQKLKFPNQALVCDINPLIGCGKWIGTWQNEVFFGISNSTLGLAGFSALLMIGLVLLTGGRFGRLLWQALSAGTVIAISWVGWFMYQSFVIERSLCPWCVVVWFVTIPLTVIVLGTALQAGHLGKIGVKAGEFIARNRLVLIFGSYLLLILFTTFWFWDQWSLVF